MLRIEIIMQINAEQNATNAMRIEKQATIQTYTQQTKLQLTNVEFDCNQKKYPMLHHIFTNSRALYMHFTQCSS